eukprot:2475321-Pyramimonas_sp.AAC.1
MLQRKCSTVIAGRVNVTPFDRCPSKRRSSQRKCSPIVAGRIQVTTSRGRSGGGGEGGAEGERGRLS